MNTNISKVLSITNNNNIPREDMAEECTTYILSDHLNTLQGTLFLWLLATI